MTAEATVQAVTANRLLDGAVIYFAGNGEWSPKIADAVTTTDGDALLAEAAKGPTPLPAVGAYLFAVTVTDCVVKPIGIREEIRAFGPTA